MTATLTTTDLPRELERRSVDGLEVVMYFYPASGSVGVLVEDARSGDAFELAVGSSDPYDVFHHPYAYAAERGIPYRAGIRDVSSDHDEVDEEQWETAEAA
jgi:hypothetical protein